MARFDALAYNEETGDLTFKDGSSVGEVMDSGYKMIHLDYKYYAQHRVIWYIKTGEWPKHEIDHKDRVRSNNRWTNLREATKSQNAQNRTVHRNNKLGIRGIRYRTKDGFYEPRLMINGKAMYLGIFKNLDLAIEARVTAEREHFTHAL